jgi:threonine aldolase
LKTIDLRSDTVSQPTPEMREAMYRAEVGDDVYGDDPTVNRLEEMAARMLGKEAALFVFSGTMGNLVSLLTHCARGDEVIMGDKAHIFINEVAGASGLGGIQLRTAPNGPRGELAAEDISAAIRAENIHYPRTALVCLENTHNVCGGTALSIEEMRPALEVARERGIPVHLDGARIFNAAVALNVPVRELARDFDTVQFCLSKGLSCPMGSMIVGPAAFIQRARKMRKMVGGGARQVGIVAAAGIVALESMIDRLAEDHATARQLAEGLARAPYVEVEPEKVETNMVFVRLRGLSVDEFCRRMAEHGIICRGSGASMRLVTHYGITREDIDFVIERAQALAAVAAI